MIAENIAVADLDPGQWRNLWDTFLALQRLGVYAGEDQGTILVLHEASAVLKVVHTRSGPIPVARVDDAHELARRLYAEHATDRVVILERRAVRAFWAEAQRLYDPALDWDEYLEQVSWRRRRVEGILIYPEEERRVLSWQAVRAAIQDWGLEDTCLVLAVFADHELWTSLILDFHGGKVTIMSTADALVPSGLKIEDWQRDYCRLVELAERRYGRPVALGAFTDHETLQGILQTEDRPGKVREALATGQIVLDPCPLRLREWI